MNQRILPGGMIVSLWFGGLLFSSGLFHLAWLLLMGSDWSGPLSLRKPALFGVSAGVTVWSMVWVLTRLAPRPGDSRLAVGLSTCLVVEVGLITVQCWRGVASHFNRTTTIDAAMESLMLVLIMLVTIGIAWLCWRSRRLLPMSRAEALALRAGLGLLLVSCGLGLLITIAGETNLARGKPPEVWGQSGVLKYPHGAALHAIQTLPLLSALLDKLKIRSALQLLWGAVVAHLFFLGHACWQTFSGRARFDLDETGGMILISAGLCLAPLVVALVRYVPGLLLGTSATRRLP